MKRTVLLQEKHGVLFCIGLELALRSLQSRCPEATVAQCNSLPLPKLTPSLKLAREETHLKYPKVLNMGLLSLLI